MKLMEGLIRMAAKGVEAALDEVAKRTRPASPFVFLAMASSVFAPDAALAQSPTNIFDPAATPAHSIFGLSMLVLSVTLGIFVTVAGLLLYALIRYRHRATDSAQEPAQIYGSNQIELSWTVIPILIVVMLFLTTTRVILDTPSPEPTAAPSTAQNPPGGDEQTSATTCCDCSRFSNGALPGRGASNGARSSPPSRYRCPISRTVLARQPDQRSYCGSREATIQLLKCQGSQHRRHLLHPAAQQRLDPSTILDAQRQLQPNPTSHPPTTAQKQPTRQHQVGTRLCVVTTLGHIPQLPKSYEH
jgi:hypothetical protein